jgi:hypothetical protein
MRSACAVLPFAAFDFQRKKSYCMENVFFVFSATLVWNISHSKKNSARYHKCAYVFIYSVHMSSYTVCICLHIQCAYVIIYSVHMSSYTMPVIVRF